jgi:mono/diheme cytochrome c family protein
MKRLGLIVVLAVALGAAVWSGSVARRQGPAIAQLANQPGANDAQATSNPVPGRMSSRVLGHDDLPPAIAGDHGTTQGTRSLFDHLVAEADGLPYPFEKLVALITKQNAAGQAPLQVLIPDGRSLLKGQADDAHPRIVMAADAQPPGTPSSLGLNLRGQLFLGFTEQAHEIEIISYNEAAGRFEFQLVQDYTANGARKLVYAKRAICESCHQGGSPIFSVRPWNETNGQPETAAHIRAAVQAHNPAAIDYLGVPFAAPLSSPERIDELTDVAAFLVAAQKAWLDQCVDAGCRRQLLAQALAYAREPGGYDDRSVAAESLRAAQARAGAITIAVPQSDLVNRDPLGERKGIRGFFRTLLKPRVKLGDGAKTNEDLEAFDRLPKLPAAQDPLSPRAPKRLLGATDLDGVYALASLFTPDDVTRLERASGHDWPRVEQAIATLPDTRFAAAPFARVPMMQALLGTPALGQAAPGYCCLDVHEMSPPIASGEPPVQLAAGSPIAPFAEHCFACHRGNPSKRLNFMSGATEAEVTASIKAKREIRDVLDWSRYAGTDKANKMMPPTDAPQRAALEAHLRQDPQLLDKMRAVVPGLFDF